MRRYKPVYAIYKPHLRTDNEQYWTGELENDKPRLTPKLAQAAKFATAREAYAAAQGVERLLDFYAGRRFI